ncbi:ribonuclease HII [bacterium]|nr:ribonuclease HII [bacterium]
MPAKKIQKLNLKTLSTPLIGVDEVGRGCLAGPVVAAAVIFKSDIDVKLYKDSKQISEEKRNELSQSIHENHFVSIGWSSVEEIDELNILQATFVAMKRALDDLAKQTKIVAGTILVDGRDRIPNMGLIQQLPIIKGDSRVSVISAASIAAKVARDTFMQKLALEFDQYGFEKHKGYGTLYHRQQIQKVGPSKWHRQSFGGVKEFVR